MASKKKHHYLPQCYIKGFTDASGTVWVYDKKKNNFHHQGKNGTFHIRYFYRVDLSKYEKISPEKAKIRSLFGINEEKLIPIESYPDMVEDLLMNIEDKASVIIKKLIDGKEITDTERMDLSIFIAFMHTRTPKFRGRVEDLHKKQTEKNLEKIFSDRKTLENAYDEIRKGEKKNKDTIDDLIKFYKEKKYKIKIPREMGVREMLAIATMMDTIIYNKTWILLRTSSNFVTSDNPTFLVHSDPDFANDKNMRLDDPRAKIIFPLSKELLLIMEETPSGPTIIEEKIDKVKTRNMNKLIASQSENYLIARDEALCKNLATYTQK